jgi:alkylglycerol monooxygenase
MSPGLIALAIPGFFVGIAVEWGVARWRGLAVYRLGDAMADMGCGIAQQLVSALVATGAITAAYGALYELRLWTLPTAWLPWVAAVVGVEVAYYWWHRLSHEVNLLWAAHVVHHQSEDYNLAVALRQSVTTWATGLPFYLPLALLGVPLLQFGVVLSLSTLYQFWIHTELVPPLGALERWLNTPALHRVHHAVNPRFLDKNHAATFSMLDRVFGTFQGEDEPCVYGTTRPLASFNPLWAQVDGYVALARLMRRAPSVGQALRVLVASPDWRPEWLGEGSSPPARVKYDPTGSTAARRYAFAQWLVLLGGVFAFFMGGGQLAAGPRWACVGLIALSLLTLPALVEGKGWARPLEAARLMAALALAVSW